MMLSLMILMMMMLTRTISQEDLAQVVLLQA